MNLRSAPTIAVTLAVLSGAGCSAHLPPAEPAEDLHLKLLRLTVQEQLTRVAGHMPVRVDPQPLIPDPTLVEVAEDAFAPVPAAEI